MTDPNVITLGLFHLFNRPGEPLFLPRNNGRIHYLIPPEYMVEYYGREGDPKTLLVPIKPSDDNDDHPEHRERVVIRVKKLAELPDLTIPMQLDQYGKFSTFLHHELAAVLINILIGVKHLEDFLSVAVYCRLRLNPQLMNYGLSVAMSFREDTKHIKIPSLIQTFPDQFVPRECILKATILAAVHPTGGPVRVEVPIDYAATDLDPEHRLAYFREDPGVNLHHWHWHIVYPNSGRQSLVNKDRRGELFYYMHQQVVARYNVERLCHDMSRAKPLVDFNRPIEEGYFPKLYNAISAYNWGARMANSVLTDVHRADENRRLTAVHVDIEDLTRWKYIIRDTIQAGRCITPSGERVPLDIDMLGNMVESSSLSVNPALYGDFHNKGHVLIAYCHDPQDKYREPFGVMAETSTAMRDPIFYRWHSYINDIFVQHKNTLPPYTDLELGYNEVSVTGVDVHVGDQLNVFQTYWAKDDVDVSMGLNFIKDLPVYVRFTHLAHAPFTYEISVNNSGDRSLKGTCRIFIAPKFDERRRQFSFEEQRHLFIELDKFTVELEQGSSTIKRNSADSSVTIPLSQIFGDNAPLNDSENYCGCGWPEYLLLPKGNYQGYQCQLFVMISNYDDDKVNGSDEADDCKNCKQAPSYCGLRDKYYPDKRAMGFPMDRPAKLPAKLPVKLPAEKCRTDTLEAFLRPNMFARDVLVKFTDTKDGNKP